MFVLKGWTGTRQQAEDLMAVPVEINIVDNKPTFALGRFEDNPPFWGAHQVLLHQILRPRPRRARMPCAPLITADSAPFRPRIRASPHSAGR